MQVKTPKIIKTELLSKNHYQLNKVTFELENSRGETQKQSRECYDMGDGAAILLYDSPRGKVLFVRQFRMPTFLNQNRDGYMIEACAGKLDGDSPEACIRREVQEEMGFTIGVPEKVLSLYSSPGAITEILHYFLAPYTPAMKTGMGGGVATESEDIEILELDFTDAMNRLQRGEIKDAKTAVLLLQLKLSGKMD